MRPHPLLTLLIVCTAIWTADAHALEAPCNSGTVFEDRNGNGHLDSGERGLADVRLSDGVRIVVTDAEGRYRLPIESGRTVFVIKPAGYAFATRPDGLPDFWRHVQPEPGPALKYGGIPAGLPGCRNFALRPDQPQRPTLKVLVFGDPQPKSLVDVDYYRRDIVEPLVGRHRAQLGLSLGDIVNDDLSLYPALNAATAKLATPWLHVAGNHDLDFDAARDEDSLRTFRNHFGPDTFAWEEDAATFIVVDDVVHQPGQRPAYIGGLREAQFAFLEHYLPTVPKDRLLVLAVHIPFFNTARPGQPETFRPADRGRLFALLQAFPHVLLLSAHSHHQQHVLHGAMTGWQGAKPLHEYNVVLPAGRSGRA